MAENTEISWCDSTFNPFIGCTKVSPGCDNCYAAAQDKFRSWTPEGWGAGKPRKRTSASTWAKPLQWNRAAEAFQAQHGRRQRVFCASLADVFDNEVPQEWRDDLFALIAATPNLDWLLLTKRIGNVGNMLPVPFDFERQYPNVWLGATIVNQAEADRDIPKLLATPAAVRFLSMEPLLGPVDLNYVRARISATRSGITKAICYPAGEPWIDWVIVGGESGPGARPMHPNWARSLRDQCAAAGVPFHFKQWGEWVDEHHARLDQPVPSLLRRTVSKLTVDGSVTRVGDPNGPISYTGIYRVGKKAAGRLLDGVTHDAFPEVR